MMKEVNRMTVSNKPNFFMIGAQKAGTTSFYYYLKGHPQIFLSEKKELHFFSQRGEELNFDAYLKHFHGSEDFPVRGEISPSYLHVPGTAKEIHQFNPDAKIIMVLRHPVDRAYSNYIHRLRVGKEKIKDFVQAMESNKDSEGADNYLRKGLYTSQVAEYTDLFPSDQLLVLIYENFKMNNDATLDAIQKFLGVEQRPLTVKNEHNTSTLPRHEALKPLMLLYSSRLAPFVKRWLPKKWLQGLKNQMTVPIEKLDRKTRKELMETYFKDDALKLQKSLNMDLSNWFG